MRILKLSRLESLIAASRLHQLEGTTYLVTQAKKQAKVAGLFGLLTLYNIQSIFSSNLMACAGLLNLEILALCAVATAQYICDLGHDCGLWQDTASLSKTTHQRSADTRTPSMEKVSEDEVTCT
jgi:hypothetical protein